MRDYRNRVKALRPNDREWYRIVNKKNDDVAYIQIYDRIGYDPWWDEGVSAAEFVKELREIKASTIDLHINSPGGEVYEGIAIYNALRDHSARIIATVDAVAASAASFVAMAGDEVVMNRHSEMMVHEPWVLCIGTAADMRETADRLDKFCENTAAIYAARAGGTVESWRQAMAEETWYSAEEAVEAGLADRVVEDEARETQEAKNRFDLRVFAHAGRAHAPAPKMRATSRELTRDNVPADKEVAKPEDGMTPEQLEKLGLPEDATEEQIDERLDELAAAEQAGGNDPDPGDGSGAGDSSGAGDNGDGTQGGDQPGSTGQGGDTATDPQNFTPPPGTVLVDAAAHQASQNRLAEVENQLGGLLKEKADKERAEFLDAAQLAGKFRASERQHYEGLWAINAEQTRNLVNALAANTVPVEEIGHGGGADVENRADDAYPAEWAGLLGVQEVKA
jgi:ATP-dependent Clp endopeptidase proteolytic subunit ClpP